MATFSISFYINLRRVFHWLKRIGLGSGSPSCSLKDPSIIYKNRARKKRPWQKRARQESANFKKSTLGHTLGAFIEFATNQEHQPYTYNLIKCVLPITRLRRLYVIYTQDLAILKWVLFFKTTNINHVHLYYVCL